MRGFLSLEPDAATHRRLLDTQNRLRDVLARQGVSFPDRLGAPLLTWPFAMPDELDEAARLLDTKLPTLTLGPICGFPNDDRPGEVGCSVLGVEALQAELFTLLKGPLDPDPPRAALVRLARVAPPSRKVGIALRGANLSGAESDFIPEALAIWNQTPQGFEVYRRMRVEDGGP